MQTLRNILSLTAILLIISSCKGTTKSRTTNTDSTSFATLSEKRTFLEEYVTFRRNYETLDFAVSYIDGGNGRVPGPTEWDIRLFAKVAPNDLDGWISKMTETTSIDIGWVASIPNAPVKLDQFQWYEDGGKWVGIHPEESIVLYRNFAN